MKGNLYVISTPIGNLGDITLRAVETLKEIDLIAAEDTRHTLKLLNHLEISKPLISYHRHNENYKTEILIEKLNKGENIALVSDAGTPGICDPGEEVIKKCIEEEIVVIPIPGACALVASLICSGLDTKEFCFLGFLPLNKKLRKQKMDNIEKESKTIVLYEAPHKLKTTLKELEKLLKDRKVVLAKEITKMHEEFIRGTTNEVLANLPENVKGEHVIIIEGNNIQEEQKEEFDTLEEEYNCYEKQGLEKKEIIKKIAKNKGVNKNEIYQRFLKD